MPFVRVLFGLILAVVASAPFARAQAAPASAGTSPHRALLNRYCITCHNERLHTAELLLDQADVEHVGARPQIWEKVVRKLRVGQMPPPGAPRPEPAALDSFATHLEDALDRAAVANPNPGRLTLSRLNRTQYTNVIRDLLDVQFDAATVLPPDDSGYGFDNIGDVLSLSPLLLDRYLTAARQVARLVIGYTPAKAEVHTYEVPRYTLQDERMSEDLPFGTRGGISVAHQFPASGEYLLQIRLKRSYDGATVLGLGGNPYEMDVRLDGVKAGNFVVGGRKANAAASSADASLEPDAGLALRIPISAGPHNLGISFVDQYVTKSESVYREHLSRFDETTSPAIASITIQGPFNSSGRGETPSREKLFVCHPTAAAEEEPCARQIITSLARQAYRRPVTPQDVEALLAPYREASSQSGFEAGIERMLQAALVAPDFLFRVERDPAGVKPGSSYRVSDVELASRLSFFLWSSGPDEQLLALAERGKLRDPATLEAQVRRMISDLRSVAMVENFTGQWLYLRNLSKVVPDPKAFPNFDENLRDALRQEASLLFDNMLREDHSVLELLNANYTFVNERLARHYGIPNVAGSHFRRVALGDENRMGLLGRGGILAVTSYPARTSPVLRGKWVLDNLLGVPPPPPPPDVPALKEKGEGAGEINRLTMRQRMEQHRVNPACSTCHRLMDPIGFALENFDGLGQWRASDGAAPIDSSGVLPDGTSFQGPVGLRNVLLKHDVQFVSTFTTKLLTYALGRGTEYYDEPSIRRIVREAAASRYSWSSIILGIVKSQPFQMRMSS